MLKITSSRFIPYIATTLIVLLALVLMLILDPWLGMTRTPFLLFFGAVMLSAWLGGFRVGLFATILSALISSYFFLKPEYSLKFDLTNAARVSLFVLQGLMFSILCQALNTTQKQLETKINQFKNDQERFRFALSNSNVSVFQQDRELRYQWLQTPKGIISQETMGKSDYDLFSSEEADKLTAIKQRALIHGTSIREEVCVTLAGEVRNYDLIIHPLQTPTGRIKGITCVAVNITGIKQIEQKLQAANQRTADILETITDAFFTVDREWRFTYVNRPFEEITHHSRQELIGRLIWRVFPEGVGSAFYDAFHRAIAQQTAVSIEAPAPHNPNIWIEAHAYPSLDGLSVYFQEVTGRKQVEEEIQTLNYQLEQRVSELQTLLDVVPVGIAIAKDPQCKLIQANPFFQKLFDIAPDTNLSVTGTDHPVPCKRLRDGKEIPPEELPMQLAARGEPVRNTELQLVRADGATFDLLGSATPIFNDQGDVRGCVAVFMDITEQKRIQKELKNSEEQLRLAVEGSAIGMWNYDLLTKNLIWSERCKAIFGLPPDTQMSYEIFINTIHPEDRDWVNQAVEEAIANRQDYNVEFRTVWRDGSVHWAVAIGRAYYNEIGSPIRMAGITQDITERKRVEAERTISLQREQAARQLAELNIQRVSQLQALTASLAQALTTEDVTRVLLNQGLAAADAKRGWIARRNRSDFVEIIGFSGYQENEIEPFNHIPLTTSIPITDAITLGQIIVIRSPEEYRQRYPDFAQKYVETGSQAVAAIPLMIEERVIGALGLSFTTPRDFSDADQSFLWTLARQCAQALDRARLYEAERIARESAEDANRVKDEFLAVLSHELRSPLNPILGWAKLLRLRQFDEDTKNRALEVIERNAKLQSQLIEDLLDVSRILQGKLNLSIVPVDLTDIIHAALETVKLAAEAKAIQITTHLSTEVRQVLGDPGRLQQILWNLLSNAVKFTPAGGTVEVYLSETSSPILGVQNAHRNPQSALSTPATYAEIKVVDTGKGIEAKFLPYVFDYFRQADSTTTRTFGGLGLGLAIVRHIVELHGGVVTAESQGEEQGSTFIVKLPLWKDQITEVDAVGESDTTLASDLAKGSTELLLCGVHILTVDDEVDMREYADFVLRQCGAEVTVAASAAEALAILPQVKPDILLSDIGMPQVDGYMLLQQVRALAPEQGGQVPAIALTAYAGEQDAQQALQAGFQMHLPKPVEPEQLVQAIITVLKENKI